MEFAVFARFYGKDNRVFMKDCRRGYPTLEEAQEAEAKFKEAGARTTVVVWRTSAGESVIFARARMQ